MSTLSSARLNIRAVTGQVTVLMLQCLAGFSNFYMLLSVMSIFLSHDGARRLIYLISLTLFHNDIEHRSCDIAAVD